MNYTVVEAIPCDTHKEKGQAIRGLKRKFGDNAKITITENVVYHCYNVKECTYL